jgi:hypothetical protein
MRQDAKTPTVPPDEAAAWEESGEHPMPEGVISVHEKKTQPPPMSPAEYRTGFVLSTPPPEPRIEGFDFDWLDEGAVPGTVPPAARRSASLARMARVSPSDPASAPPRRRLSEPTGECAVYLPPAPPLPVLSIPAVADSRTSSPERVAVSTDRPTRRGAEAELGDPFVVLQLVVTRAELAALDLDHRTGFVLSLLDGQATLEEVLDMSPLPEDELRSVLTDLLCRGIVGAGVRRSANTSLR